MEAYLIFKSITNMKFYSKGLLAICFVGTILSACDKSEENDSTSISNHLKIGDNEYALSGGILEDYGADEFGQYEGYNIDLSLLSDGFTMNGDGSISGSGTIIYFEMFSESETGLASGEYVYDGTSPYPTESFDYGDYSEDFSVNESNATYVDIASGTVTVVREGSSYEITIACVDENGKAITGFYSGSLEFFEDDVDPTPVRKAGVRFVKRDK